MRGCSRFLAPLVCLAMAGLPGFADDRPSYTIYLAGGPITIDGRLDEPAWFAAPSVGPFRFAWWKAGKKEQTVAKMLWDDEYLYVAFLCQDAHVSAVQTRHDTSVWLDDCVEVFVAPERNRPDAYFNLEMNVNGAVYDDFHPHGAGSERRPGWNAKGLQIATHVNGTLNNDADQDDSWTLEVAIPFKAYRQSLPNVFPKPGDVWRLNLNRCGGKTNEQFSQWAPGTEKMPQFHTPRDFGFVHFSAERMPF
jgi:cellulose/xylan binding protein with CBM9 domain